VIPSLQYYNTGWINENAVNFQTNRKWKITKYTDYNTTTLGYQNCNLVTPRIAPCLSVNAYEPHKLYQSTLTNSTEQGPSGEANSSSVSQEILCIL
jgi:hypothetical protein